jgi:YfiH family protein
MTGTLLLLGDLPMQIYETPVGFEIDTPEYLFFFGKRDAELQTLQKNYSEFEFLRVKQVHGNQIHCQNDLTKLTVEADGHWTTLPKKALAISTADCVPVLIVHPGSEMLMALHAGWRGVVSRIIPKGLQIFQESGAKSEQLYALIGPHIQQTSFEVDLDVKNQLLTSAGLHKDSGEQIVLPSANKEKFLVDLNAIVKMQLAEFSLSPDQVFDLHLNTFSDKKFHSFRRDKESSGRQLSFVVKK